MMMKSRLLIAAAFVASLFASGAQANYVVKDGNGVIQTIQAGVLGGNILPYMSLTDQTGVAFGTVGNPLAIQFGAGITLPSFSVAQHFICDSGCGGGGGGGGLSVPFGGAIGANGTPVGFKDASGNLQPLLGDVTNGQWVNIKLSVLPTGAATSAFQATNSATTPHTCSTGGYSEIGCLGQIDDDIRGPIGAGSASIGTVGLNAGSNTVGFIGNTSFAATQATASALNATVVNAGTFAVQATQAGSWTIANTSFTVTQSTGTNLHMVCDSGCSSSSSPSFGGAFPATGTPIGMSQGGNLTAFTGTSGNLNVQCANCSGSGVSTSDGATFTAGSSLFAGAGGFYQTTPTSNPLTAGFQGMVQLTQFRAVMTNIRNSSGAELGLTAAPFIVAGAGTAGTATGGVVTVQGVASMTPLASNLSQINGAALSSSNPLFAQLTAGSAAIGSITNTSFAATQATASNLNATVVGTGTFATQSAITAAASSFSAGAFVSGSVLSGAYASGALVDVTNLSTPITPNSATATKGVLLGMQFNSTQATFTNGQQGTIQGSSRGAQFVAVGADGFTISNTSFAVTQSTSPWIVAGGGTAGTPGTAVMTVQGISGGTAQPMSLASASVASGAFASGSVASGAYASGSLASGAVVDLTNIEGVIGNATAPTKMALGGAVFNSSVLTLTTGQSAALQADANGYLNVHIQAGAGAGGTSSNFSATFPSAGTAAGAEYLSSAPTLTTGQMVALQVTSAGSLHTTVDNTNANGSAVSASSSPVVIASDQAAVAVKAASAAFASGSIASGAVASGAVSAGAFVSGSVLSGAYASGALVDITNVSTPIAPNTATATKGILIGGQFNSTQETLTTGQQGQVALSARGAIFVAVGADGFAVTNAGTFAVQATLNTTPTIANGNGVVPTQGGSVISTTNGSYSNLLQGNAVISATNGIYANVLQGNAVLSLTNPSFASITDGTTKAKVEPASTPAATTDAALAVAPIPSELHVGETGSNQIAVQVAQTVTASAYTTGNALGGLMTIAGAARVSGTSGASGTGGILMPAMLTSKSVQTVQVDVFFFNANPSGSTCTDKTAFVLAAADAGKVVGVQTIPGTAANGAGWFSGGTGSLGIPSYFPISYSLGSATSIFACAVVRGAFTPASTSDVAFNYTMLRD